MEDTYMNQDGVSVLWDKTKSKVEEVFETKFVDGVLPIEFGGTGGATASEAIKALTENLPSSLNGSFYYPDLFIPTYVQAHAGNETTYPERTLKMTLSQAMSWINNRSTSVKQANVDYTTYMGRGIAFVTSVPDSMVNGTCVFVY